jgi:hypothetical protein
VDKHNGILDYTDLDGSFLHPTPQDCHEHKPNALSWGVPIEDGPMFKKQLPVTGDRLWRR